MQRHNRQNNHSKSSAPKNSVVVGRNAVRQLLTHQPKRVQSLLVSESKDRMDHVGKELFELAASKKIQVQIVPKERLFTYARNPQGFVAIVDPVKFMDISDLEELASMSDKGVIVAIDGVKDPQNLGSILRACDCFGVLAVVWSKNRSVSVTEVVSKVSAGASEFVRCVEVSNLREALNRLKKLGFSLVSAMVDANAKSIHQYAFSEKSVIILGGESQGVQPLIAKESDQRIFIPVNGVVDSLNVGQAASVFLYAYMDSTLKLK